MKIIFYFQNRIAQKLRKSHIFIGEDEQQI